MDIICIFGQKLSKSAQFAYFRQHPLYITKPVTYVILFIKMDLATVFKFQLVLWENVALVWIYVVFFVGY